MYILSKYENLRAHRFESSQVFLNWSCGHWQHSVPPLVIRHSPGQSYPPSDGIFVVCIDIGITEMWRLPRGWFSMNMPSYQYRNSYCGDKTILCPSYLHNGIPYTGKMNYLFWIWAQVTDSLQCHPLLIRHSPGQSSAPSDGMLVTWEPADRASSLLQAITSNPQLPAIWQPLQST